LRLSLRSLFARTAITIALSLSLFLTLSLGAGLYFVLLPVAQRSAEDLAAEIVTAAHALQDSQQEQHAAIRDKLLVDHGLIVTDEAPSHDEKPFESLFFNRFHEALTDQAGQPVRVSQAGTGPLVWVDVLAHGKTFRIGFDRNRLRAKPHMALLIVIGAGALLTLVTSLAAVRKVTGPIEQLSAAVNEIVHGKLPPSVPETGPEEIAGLARGFNHMASELQTLAENRTVVIAGISHDLRTPLTRLAIAVEMLHEAVDPKLIASIQRNLLQMNELIGQFLEFSGGVESSSPVQVDLWRTIESCAEELRRDGLEIRLQRRDSTCAYFVDPVALDRVLTNILRNAARYGAGRPVDVFLTCRPEEVAVEVADRGPGIPADQVEKVFRPFHRLDTAREASKGGAGLGLAIVKQIADKNGWTIDLRPRDGGGTVARLGLPPSRRFGFD
jgi:two-component system osmolarity sensor histidine kinase EnvZ